MNFQSMSLAYFYRLFVFFKIKILRPDMISHVCNSSYLGGGGRRIMSSRPDKETLSQKQ
jgi:hypothetical protein